MRFLLGHLQLYEEKSFVQLDFQNVEEKILDLELGSNRKEFQNHKGWRMFKSHIPFAPEATSPHCDEVIGKVEPTVCACPNCPEFFKKVLYLVRDGRDALCR